VKEKIQNKIIELDKKIKEVEEELSSVLTWLNESLETDKDISLFKKLREIRKKVSEL
jgi:hypothetical protein